MLRWIVWRDLMLAWRRRADMLSTVFFFVIVVSLFPLGIGPETQLLRTIAPGVVWVAALLASMLSLGRLFANDARLSIFELPVALRPIAIDMLAAAARTEEAALTWLREQCVEVSAIIGSSKHNAEIDQPRIGSKMKSPGRSRSILAHARKGGRSAAATSR